MQRANTKKTSSARADQSKVVKPGYKHTKLGWIPEEWDALPLSKLVRSDRKIRYGIVQAGPHMSNGIPCLRVVDLTEDHIQLEKLYRTSSEISAQYQACILKTNDIVFALRGEIGKVALVDEVLAGINITRGVARISPSERIEPKYLYHQLQSPSVRTLIDLQVNGTSLKEVPIAGLNRVEVPVPPSLHEQRRIAQVLGAWDRAIATVQQLLAAQQERKRGVMQELLTGRRRFKGFGGKWKPTRFDEIFTPKKEKAGAREFEVLSVTTKGLVSQAEYFDRKVASEDRSNYLVVRNGDFVFSGLNFWMGSVDLVWDFEVGIISPAYKCFEVDQAVMHLDYARWFVRSQVMLKALVKSSIQGASIVRRNLDGEQLAAWLFDLPGLDEQRKIADALTACDLEVRSLEQELDHLTTQKRGLMQQLLTGAVRVNGFSRSEE